MCSKILPRQTTAVGEEPWEGITGKGRQRKAQRREDYGVGWGGQFSRVHRRPLGFIGRRHRAAFFSNSGGVSRREKGRGDAYQHDGGQ